MWSSSAWAQSIIHGAILDENRNALEDIHVLIQGASAHRILGYAISDSQGNFSVTLNSTLDSLVVKTQSLNYSTQRMKVRNRNQVLNFTLYPEVKELQEVCVKAPHITQHGDTLTFSVSAFSHKKDQVIADVLNRMPGLEIEPGGRILYQGKPIQKYYIEGLDLLEGKYSLANNNLPAESVASVQVLENHQPIKMLRKVSATDNASLNIKLKKKVTTTGKAHLGLGMEPFLWDVNLTPMLFTRKQQLVCSYQSNNVGKDVAQELTTLTLEDLVDLLENDTSKEELLGIQGISVPEMAAKRHLFNSIHLLNTNYLVKLKNDLELRINTSYLNDYQKQHGESQSLYFLTNDTIRIQEQVRNRLQYHSLQSNITLTRNTVDNYLKNSFKIKSYWDAQRGSVVRNNQPLQQDYQNPFYSFSNKLNLIKPVGKQMVEFSSFMAFNRAPQTLRVEPGVFQEKLNGGEDLEAVWQDVCLTDINLNHSVGLIRKMNRWTFSPRLGFQYQGRNFDSHLDVWENQVSHTLGESFQNDLDLRKLRSYLSTEIQYNTERLKINGVLPIAYVDYDVSDAIARKEQKKEVVLMEPRLSLSYDLSGFFRFKSIVKRTHKVDDRRQINYGYVLGNYRKLQKKEALLGESTGQSFTSVLYYKNPLKSLFLHVGYTYTSGERDLLPYNQIESDGSMVLQVKREDNRTSTHNLFIQGSKYVSDWKTNILMKGRSITSRQKMILNGQLVAVENKNMALGLKVNASSGDWLSGELKSDLSFFSSKVEAEKAHWIQHQSHAIKLNVYPSSRESLGMTAEYYRNEGRSNSFVDLVYRHTFKNARTHIEATWLNVFDNASYTSYRVDEYSVIRNYYELRPSQIRLALSFSF